MFLYILIILLYIFLNNFYNIYYYVRDIMYIFNIEYKYKLKKNDFNFIYKKEDFEHIKILIISFDDRINIPYFEIHKKIFIDYSNKWNNIDYEFINNCDKNVYWCKLFIILEKIKLNKYDYIMWVDSDVIITDIDKSIQQILYHFDSDIFISYDNINSNKKNNNSHINSGIFIIKNSKIGINFLEECINNYNNSKCLDENNNLLGIYSNRCYEQGTMGNLIHKKYKDFTTILSSLIFNNTNNCTKKGLFLHHFKGDTKTNDDLYDCFMMINEIN